MMHCPLNPKANWLDVIVVNLDDELHYISEFEALVDGGYDSGSIADTLHVLVARIPDRDYFNTLVDDAYLEVYRHDAD